VFANVVPRRIFQFTIKKLTGSCRIIHNEEFRCLCSPSDIYADKINEGEMGGFCSMHSVHEKCVQSRNNMAYFMIL
jgi:hypothetical protein